MLATQLRQFTETGISGLDQMLDAKGIPTGHNIFILGSPGSGKTTLAVQYLHYGATKANEPGIFVTLDENPDQIRENVLAYGWDLEKLEAKGLLTIVDASPLRRVKSAVNLGNISIGKKDFSLVSLIEIIKRNAIEMKAKRIVIDPLATFMFQYPNEFERRDAFITLLEGISELGATSLFVSEVTHTSVERAHQFEEYLAEGVVLMLKRVVTEGMERLFQIEKMRGVNHDTKPRPYSISDEGIRVFPTEQFV